MEEAEQDSTGLEDDEEEALTARTALEAIESAWLNEKFAPEILPHRSDLVDCMLQQIAYMEENVKGLPRRDFRVEVHRMELERIRFVISSYLRTRLEKIERYAIHLLPEEANRTPNESYLTPGELKFAKEYLSSMEVLFRMAALNDMPTNFQTFELSKFAVRPNLQSHVFLRSNKKVSGIVVPGTLDEEIDFEPGSQHIVRYSAVADLVKDGTVQLI